MDVGCKLLFLTASSPSSLVKSVFTPSACDRTRLRLDGCVLPSSRRSVLPYACATFEPTYPVTSPQDLPAALFATTVYHNIPSTPEHLGKDEVTPPAHPCDGDGYILALSFAGNVDSKSWIRGRFVRTKPFFIESRQQRRIFRGYYGTPGVVGVDAPVKPKASSAKGVCPFVTANGQLRVVSFGIRAVPMALNIDTLVSRGPTSLGGVMTDSEELVDQRATEMSVAPVVINENLNMTVGVSRAPSGRIIGAFVTERDGLFKLVKKYKMINVPSGCDVVGMVACEQYCVIAMQRISEEKGGFLSAVFGSDKQKEAPIIDRKYGTALYLLSRETGVVASCVVADVVLSNLNAVTVTSSSEVMVDGIDLTNKSDDNGKVVTRLSTVMDSRSGELWGAMTGSTSKSKGFESKAVSFSLNVTQSKGKATVSVTEMKYQTITTDGSIVMLSDCLCVSPTSKVYTVYDVEGKRSGLVMDHHGEDRSQQSWMSSHDDDRLHGLALSPDKSFLSLLATSKQSGARILIFNLAALSGGPVGTVPLDSEKFGHIGASVGSVWVEHESTWTEEARTPKRSSYEIFDAREWNDIDSGFKSLGF